MLVCQQLLLRESGELWLRESELLCKLLLRKLLRKDELLLGKKLLLLLWEKLLLREELLREELLREELLLLREELLLRQGPWLLGEVLVGYHRGELKEREGLLALLGGLR